jgi:hypothetical protein
MKTLVYFVDMLRVADFKGNFKLSYLEMFQTIDHGKILLNSYSTKPNTPGTLNSFFFGVSLIDNPSRFVDTYPHESELDSFLGKPTLGKVSLYAYSPEPDNSQACFPKDADIFFFEDEEEFWSRLETEEDDSLFIFVDNDYHGTISDYSSTLFGERVADSHFLRRIPRIAQLAKESGATKLLIFSDHGFHSSSDFANSLKPLGKHRSGVLWYETDFASSLEIDNLLAPVSRLARAFFSEVTNRVRIGPGGPEEKMHPDSIVEDSWLPPFLQVVLRALVGTRLKFDFSATSGKTELHISRALESNPAEQAGKKGLPKPWRGSFLSEARVSMARPRASTRLLAGVLSKALFALQITSVWVGIFFKKPSIEVTFDNLDDLKMPRATRWCLGLIGRKRI